MQIYNDRGVCFAGAVVTDAIRPGVMQLSTRAWFKPLDPPEVRSLDQGTAKLEQCCVTQTALMGVKRFDGEAPEITALSPPVIVQRCLTSRQTCWDRRPPATKDLTFFSLKHMISS
jgi:biotin/methionine sulfoxide reductase